MREYKETHHSLLFKSNSDLTLYSAGHEACSPGQNYGPRVRPYNLIHFVLRGQGELHIGDHVFHAASGDAFLIPAGQVAYYEASRDEPWTYAWVCFLGIQAENYLRHIMTSTEEIYIIRGLSAEKYETAILELLTFQDDTTSSYFAVNSILLRIMSYLFSDIAFQEQEWGRRNGADKIRFYLDMNYFKNLKLKDVASDLGFHPHYMTRIFREQFGIPPKQYLIELKLKKACGLLKSTQLPVAVVAESLGFEDALAFSKLFKKEFSVSPSAYRKGTF
ncbi:MAG: AraC family transcriptional regulator [Lachnospiraceae bacterium]|jgi:AraC-like DNA-binding protein/mannose-6-phosphate isomerase-like protein (cupin superfamily)|uniref:AraC family transcriptional regulator n=1 Tax=Candidatus Merdisoma sp. JLR.KK006 TaxID=3112626 RepID=UPI002FF37688|nr:AraC family transcriptional regulator [Lachnospiraceae bacterium]